MEASTVFVRKISRNQTFFPRDESNIMADVGWVVSGAETKITRFAKRQIHSRQITVTFLARRLEMAGIFVMSASS